MEFLIGFEFEFGWLPVIPSEQLAFSKRIGKFSYFENFILKNTVSSLKSYLGDNYCYISDVVEDPTIKFSPNYKKSHYGVEVITKPIDEATAIILCEQILKWMSETPEIATNSTCGLHINISFSQTSLNSQVDYFNLLQNTPQAKILETFNRTGNTYCQSSDLVKFNVKIDGKPSRKHNYTYWLNKIVNTDLDEQFKLKSVIKKSFLKQLKNIGKNISIVDKQSPTDERYFEFRMIGNAGYEQKNGEILFSMQEYKEALKESLILDKKKPSFH